MVNVKKGRNVDALISGWSPREWGNTSSSLSRGANKSITWALNVFRMISYYTQESDSAWINLCQICVLSGFSSRLSLSLSYLPFHFTDFSATQNFHFHLPLHSSCIDEREQKDRRLRNNQRASTLTVTKRRLNITFLLLELAIRRGTNWRQFNAHLRWRSHQPRQDCFGFNRPEISSPSFASTRKLHDPAENKEMKSS